MRPIEEIIHYAAYKRGIPADWVYGKREHANSKSSVLLRGAVCHAAKADGWSEAEIGRALSIDPSSVNRAAKRFEGKKHA